MATAAGLFVWAGAPLATGSPPAWLVAAARDDDLLFEQISKLGRNRILKTPGQKQLWEPLSQVDESTWYGWGWWLFEFEGHPVVGMFGAQPRVHTALPVLPGRRLAVMALGNCLGSVRL